MFKLFRLRIEMFNVILLGTTILPLIGIFLMENGAIGMNVTTSGYWNGATAAYALHLVVLFCVYKVVGKYLGRKKPAERRLDGSEGQRRRAFQRVAYGVIVINSLLALFLYFIAGADDVWSGEVKKGDFRSSLGGFGVFAYMARDFLTPMFCALVAFVYRRSSPSGHERVLMGANMAIVFLNASLWGYKVTAVVKLLPTLLLLLPPLSLSGLLVFGGFAYISTVVFGVLFDNLTIVNALTQILDRATIGTGDTAWKIWDVRDYVDAFPPYWPTLLSGLGGRLGTFLNVYNRQTGGYEWYDSDFAALITLVAKDYAMANVSTSNVSATSFGEGVIAFGVSGFLYFSALAGIVVAVSRNWLERAKSQNRPLMAMIAANFAGFAVQNWLEAGGITVLLNFPHVVSYAVTAFLAHKVLNLAGWPMGVRRVIPAAGPRARAVTLPMNEAESLGYPTKAPETGR